MLLLNIRIGTSGFLSRETGCIWMVARQVVINIAFLDEAHSNSSCMVEYLNGARLERRQDC
jgi:hypothetical protein